jgi:predicted permease
MRYALRTFLRSPVLFAASVLTLAVGTGLATGVLAVAYGVLLRPLPYREPDRLVVIALHPPGVEDRDVGIRLTEFAEWRSRFRVFEQVAGHNSAELSLRGAGDARSVRTAMVTDGFFETLGLAAAEGTTQAFGRDAPAVAVSSRLADQIGRNGPWRERGVTLGTNDFRVAAVMPVSFAMPSDDTDLWVRADAVPEITLFGFQDQRRFQLIGRLGPGVTLEQASEDARRVAREIDGSQQAARRRDATLRPLHDRPRQEARATVIPFVAGSILVLLIACANVSGLLVGRASAREREFAVRRALGASAGRIGRASLAESFAVAIPGWVLGLWIALLVIRAFESLAAGAIANLQNVSLDPSVVLASFVLAVLVALLSGGAPAWRAIRSDPNAALKTTSERIGRGRSALRSALVISQIALTVVLLVSAALLMRTVNRLVAEERGFTTANALAMRLRLTQTLRFEVNERAPFINRLVSDVRALPGVVAAGVGSDLPPNGTQLEMSIRIVTEKGEESMYRLSPSAVTPGYLEALGVTLKSGRLFEEKDRQAARPPIVITDAAARMMFPGIDPVGRDWPATLPGPAGTRVTPTVIGVVRDIKHKGLDAEATAVVFTPWERLAPTNAHLVVRTSGRADSLAPALRRIVQQLDPTLPLFPVQTLDEVVARTLAPRRLREQLSAMFAALALALAVIALWGAMAQSVLDRRRELAVRLALGSTSTGAVGLMLRGGLTLIALGVALGAAGGIVTARLLQHLLHGVTPSDPVAFGAGTAIAALISAVACYLPARRAARINPTELLRES